SSGDQSVVRAQEFLRRHEIALLTMLFTDIVGSTGLKQELGDQAAIQFIQRHHALVRDLLAQFPGAEEIGTAGDSFFLVFVKPSDAARFALKLQSALRRLSREAGQEIKIRIGIHVGEVFARTEGEGARELFGMQIDTAARVMGLGDGDQILLSRFAFDSARQVLRGSREDGLGELSWLNHGYYSLKGVEEPVEVCEVGETGVAVLRPPGDSSKAHRFHAESEEPVLGWRPAPGQLVPNTRWRLDLPLGEGGFGEVWLARHEELKQERVFKFCFNAERARSLKREVTLFRVLRERVGSHPNIVGIHDVFFDQPPYYVVMEYVEGSSLAEWPGANTAPLASKLEIVAQIADALQAAHDAGVIHRDVKPGNILLCEKKGAPHAMLSDFGIGQVVSAEALAGVTSLGFTETMITPGSSAGTQIYMAPELIAGRPATIRSDIYALGVIIYQLALGDLQKPLTSDWAEDIEDPLLRDDIRSCVAGDPAKRFAGAAQVAANLRQLPQRQAALADEQARIAAIARSAYRRGVIRAASISVIIIAVVATLGVV
ncbi:MAG TPA: protein kinase, partial [Chthoniobacterales bacterium]